MQITIDCHKRAAGSKPNALRRSGQIPAVLYGHKGTESLELTIDAKKAELLVRDASVNNTLIDVSIPELPWTGKALLREIQVHPWKRYLYHLSFFSVSAESVLEITVPLHFVGEAYGVKQESGVMESELTELTVKCLPDRIPESIEIDVTDLKVGDALHVHELPLPEGVTAQGEASRVVVMISATRAGTGETAAEAAAAV
ncbi:MAG: 50S ribosomal protein L25/general stress protein Ctc [Candidatus Parcubacteria bacterium]|uniref:50S ribosomal protein L25/general stress protein Ctc n=1 Tax=Phormidesmis priestleyi TaxID=268141 RepID=UPI00083B69E9|nr:50S ribosomal protein L25/general stress protein Ctc [Phormidesmis priestleyi]MBC7824085.1 50S ribosomal protein L25/general stress protein Ctc [Leptolyngbyaceae cyanobacterium LF-bin-113]